MKRPALFMDRDGTISEEVGYVNHPSRFRLFPYSADAIKLLNDNGWLAILVTNQAGVHRWFAATLGQEVAPLASLEEGVATWPEFATCVGVYLNGDGTLGVVAPHGLDDLFGLRVRHNPQRASAATYRERVQAKRFAERWPRLSIEAA